MRLRFACLASKPLRLRPLSCESRWQKRCVVTLLRRSWDPIRDKKAGEDFLRRSPIDWTLIYPTLLTDGPRTGKYRVGEHLELRGLPKVSRADVADLSLKLLADSESVHRELVVSS
jgi:putative NADH-flavin reductase